MCIFDGLTDTTVSEVKNVARQSLTLQLPDSMSNAQSTRTFDLYVRPDTCRAVDRSDRPRRRQPEVYSMTRGGKRSGGTSAAELMAELAQDREFQEAAAKRAAARQERASEWREAEGPIVEDLRQVGVDVASVWDLVNTSKPYPAALPVLMEHLERGGYPDRVSEGVARALAVKPAAVYWHRLRDLYLEATGPDATEGLAVALAAAADSAHLDDLLALLNESSRGTTRIHFIRPILRVGGVRGRQAVEALRDDPVFGKEATALPWGR